ncbi:MAG: DUF2141 domain-containing protein [Candidatus Korobacteraceae bacterium]|jgi:uncharacterized protein (DUF2141 family)
MRGFCFCAVLVLLAVTLATAQQPAPAASSAQGYTLTVLVEGVDERDGNIGVLVFNSPKGWAEDRTAALRDSVVPAHPGTVTVTIPNLPAGEYAVSLVHDVNKNHKLDRNWLGKPTEQWGLSNNPHAVLKTPSYNSCTFMLKGDQEIHIKMQQ